MWAVAYGRRLQPPSEGDGLLAHPEVSGACGCLAWHPHWALWGDGKLLVLDGYRYVAARVANWQNGGVWDGKKYSAELAVERGLAIGISADGSDIEKQREESPLVPAAPLSPASGSPNKKKKKKKRRKSESVAGKKRSPKPRPSVPAITNDGGLE